MLGLGLELGLGDLHERYVSRLGLGLGARDLHERGKSTRYKWDEERPEKDAET